MEGGSFVKMESAYIDTRALRHAKLIAKLQKKTNSSKTISFGTNI